MELSYLVFLLSPFPLFSLSLSFHNKREPVAKGWPRKECNWAGISNGWSGSICLAARNIDIGGGGGWSVLVFITNTGQSRFRAKCPTILTFNQLVYAPDLGQLAVRLLYRAGVGEGEGEWFFRFRVYTTRVAISTRLMHIPAALTISNITSDGGDGGGL